MGRRGLLVATSIVGMALAPGSASAADFAVTSTADAVDATVGDGVCDAGAGCTLRAAVQEADSAGGTSTITVPAGRYRLTIVPVPQAGSAADVDPSNGDLDLTADITVKGAGPGRTILDGGGIDRFFETGSDVETAISDLTITGGDSTAAGSQEIDLGGAILNKSGITLERVELAGNKADGGGGMFSIPGTMPVVRDSLITANSAFEGGGLRIDHGATIINTTITGNSLRAFSPDDLPGKPVGLVVPAIDEIAGYGGGIDHRGGADLTIINSTITGNTAVKGGGGIGAGQGYAPLSDQLPLGHVILRNTIIAGNSSATGPGDCRTNQVGFASLGHNLDSDGTCFLTEAGDRPNTDPKLAALNDNGGPTRTQALLAGSPAIDAGAAEDCPKADARGTTRPQGPACDIGAFEYVAPAPAQCTRVVRLPRRLRKRARSFDVLAAGKVLARGRRPAARVTIPRAISKVTLRVRLRDGRAVRVRVKVRCTP